MSFRVLAHYEGDRPKQYIYMYVFVSFNRLQGLQSIKNIVFPSTKRLQFAYFLNTTRKMQEAIGRAKDGDRLSPDCRRKKKQQNDVTL